MCSNNSSFKIIADIFPLWHCVITHLNAPNEQNAKTSYLSAFDYHHPSATSPLYSFGSSKGVHYFQI